MDLLKLIIVMCCLTWKNLKKISLLINVFLISCLLSCLNLTDEQKAMSRLVQNFSKDVKKKYNLLLSATGEINYKGMHKIDLRFSSNLTSFIDTSRDVIVRVSLDLLLKLNSDKKLEEISKYYPFSLNNLSIGILFSSVPKTDYESVVMVLMTNDSVTFYSRDPSKPSFRIVHEETFEEALAIVNQSTNQDMSQPLQP